MQYRNRTIEFIASVALATMIDEYAIFGPKSGDRLPSFFGVSLSEHLVEIAFDEGVYGVRHSSPAYFRLSDSRRNAVGSDVGFMRISCVSHHEGARGMRRAVPRRIRRAALKPRKVRRGRVRSPSRGEDRAARPT